MYAHGTFMWNELATRDPEAAKRFYTALIGWQTEAMEMGPAGTYTIWKNKGENAGGMLTMNGPQFEGIPPHWMGYLAVADVDECARRTPELGGSVKAPPFDVPTVGRICVIQDPTGAVLALMTPEGGTTP